MTRVPHKLTLKLGFAFDHSRMADLQGYDIELREHKASDLGNALALAKGQMDEVTRQQAKNLASKLMEHM